ncbi:hypothetical protein [Campylobacter aviculae]|uniref:hypothetical protein n=1 Tax=Campylobacter aviculae TaxID=2510190 RepID=UPI001485AD73|nr:hypothetical protein [Campylobacter aviculae]
MVKKFNQFFFSPLQFGQKRSVPSKASLLGRDKKVFLHFKHFVNLSLGFIIIVDL